ncbi:MAG: hypothetical protein ACTSSN_10235 [Candidatus Heimdallarchaeaceae archaeon]
MQIFERNLTKNHDVGEEWPSFLGHVELGEAFIIKTMNQECDPNGPIELVGVKKDDCVAIHIENIEIV